jgi:hypothetical protein
MTNMYSKTGKKRSTSRVTTVMEVDEQTIDDRFGDAPS